MADKLCMGGASGRGSTPGLLLLMHFHLVKGTSELKAHGDGRGHQAKEGNAASEIARGIRTKQGNIEGALRNSEAAAVQQRRVKDETLKAEASLATLMATHNLPLRTIIFDGFLPFLTLFTTF